MKNKKILFGAFAVLLVAMLNLCFTSCGDDDDEPSLVFETSTIVGTWKITEVGAVDGWAFLHVGGTMTFRTNGSCETAMSMEDYYKIENGRIKTYYKETMEPMYVYTLLSVDGATMTARMSGTLDERHKSTTLKLQKQ